MRDAAENLQGTTRPTRQCIRLGGAELVADPSGALFWPVEATMIVADLHLEKGSAFARRGQMLPPYDTQATLLRLASVIDRLAPRRIIALGDSFHDDEGSRRLAACDARRISELQRGRTWVWISGNHDRAAPTLDGEWQSEATIAGVRLRHEPDPSATAPEIAGHLHPAARLVWGAGSVRARCFASSAARLVLPAFGAFTGGLNVMSAPFAALFEGLPGCIDMLGSEGLYRVPRSALVGD